MEAKGWHCRFVPPVMRLVPLEMIAVETVRLDQLVPSQSM
jgi:hypothetical protein